MLAVNLPKTKKDGGGWMGEKYTVEERKFDNAVSIAICNGKTRIYTTVETKEEIDGILYLDVFVEDKFTIRRLGMIQEGMIHKVKRIRILDYKMWNYKFMEVFVNV